MPDVVPAVLRFRDGRVVRVMLPKVDVPEALVRATADNGEELEVLLESLKGIFYLKEQKERLMGLGLPTPSSPSGTTATVEFEDSEVLTGKVGRFDVSQPGFFLYPINPTSNNAKVYVVTAAVRSLELRP
ncbi:MAG: DUF6982 domain-containing protein [Acidobacteriota bacterium]